MQGDKGLTQLVEYKNYDNLSSTAILYNCLNWWVIVRMFLSYWCPCPTQVASFYEPGQWRHYQTGLHKEICTM